MEWLTFWRGIKSGIKNFFRNGWLSVATISIIVLTLFLINLVFLITVIANETLEDVQEKIDVSLYLKSDANDREINAVIDTIKRMPEVKEVKYISKDEALDVFKEKHKEDEIILKSIEELGNPLQPSLSVKMENPQAYQRVFDDLKASELRVVISDIDYYSEKKPIVERLSNIINRLRQVGLIVILLFSAIAVLVTFNSIRLTMYNYRREVEIMKLVGANRWFIRFPFIIEGMMYGFFSAWISIILFYPLVYFSAPYLGQVASSVDIVNYLNTHAIKIIVIQLSSGILLGAVSSLIAIRKYLKI